MQSRHWPESSHSSASAPGTVRWPGSPAATWFARAVTARASHSSSPWPSARQRLRMISPARQQLGR